MSALMAHLFKGASLLRSKKCLQLWFGFFIYHFTIKGFLFQLTAVPSNKIMVWLGIYFISCFTQVSLSYICCKVFGISTCLRFIGNSELSHALTINSTWRWCLASCQRWVNNSSSPNAQKKSYTLNIEAPLGMLFGMLLLLFKEQAALTESSHAVSNWGGRELCGWKNYEILFLVTETFF